MPLQRLRWAPSPPWGLKEEALVSLLLPGAAVQRRGQWLSLSLCCLKSGVRVCDTQNGSPYWSLPRRPAPVGGSCAVPRVATGGACIRSALWPAPVLYGSRLPVALPPERSPEKGTACGSAGYGRQPVQSYPPLARSKGHGAV